MERRPLSEVKLYDILLKAEAELRPKAARFWEFIKIDPERWHAQKYGSGSASFWAVGLFGQRVIWYNEIESQSVTGFVLSNYHAYGQIGDRHTPEDELRYLVEQLIRHIEGEQAYSS
jgi:hypothetical protein